MNLNRHYIASFPFASHRAAAGFSLLLAGAALSALAVPALAGNAPGERPVELTQDPLVMRLSKDEFRIAFGIAANGAPLGCNGVLHYRVTWKSDDGITRTDSRLVSYAVSPAANRTLTVDRQFFDTAEGQHTTEILNVHVDPMSCVDADTSAELASAAAPDSVSGG